MTQPDFRAKAIDPSLLQAYIQSKSRDKFGNAVAGASKGFQTGLGIIKSVDEMREKKKRAESLQEVSELIKQDETLTPTEQSLLGASLMDSPSLTAQIYAGMQKRKQTPATTDVPIYEQDAEGNISATGETMEKGGKVLKSLERQKTEKETAADVQIEKEVSAAEAKQIKQRKRDARIAFNKLGVTISLFRGYQESTGGEREGFVGRMEGLFKKPLAKVTANEFARTYEGMLVEAASSLAKLASPSARVGQRIINMFKKTLPDLTSTTSEGMNQIRFSLHNAMATALGEEGESYTPEMMSEIDTMFGELLALPPARILSEIRKDASKKKGKAGNTTKAKSKSRYTITSEEVE